jgi:phage baseplate assembly protein W
MYKGGADMGNNLVSIIGITLAKINLFPATVVEEIMQNIRILLTTVVGSVPLDRKLGLNAVFIDEPEPRAMMKLSIFTVETIQDYEPRVEVKDVTFTPNPEDALDGRLYPKVTVRILDEFLS